MERLDDLALFLRVLDLGSISAAAHSLELSVAVASQRLKRLERGMGVQLLHRTTRRLWATSEGAALAERGRPLIEDLEALTSGMRSGEITGTLRIGAPASFGRLHLSPLLPRFLERHPRLRLSAHLSDELIDLGSRGLDVALRIGALDASSLVARKIADDPRILVASPDYLARRGTPKKPADLAQHDWLRLLGQRPTLRLRDARGREETVRVEGRYESSLGEALCDAAVAGLGIARHSTWLVRRELAAGRLVRVLPSYTTLPESGIYAVMPARRLLPPRVRAFVDFLCEQLPARLFP
ncbi:MAG: LysR family transcriptional regulator [Polyangiales bacterium]